MHSPVIIGRLVAVMIAGFPLVSSAITLDWDAVDWTSRWQTAGPTNNNPVSQAFVVEGVTVTITVQRGTSTGTGEVSNATTTPDDTNATVTNAANEQGLMVDVDYTQRTTAMSYAGNAGDDYLTFTISFSSAVNNVQFQLWDIDLGNDSTPSRYQDVVIFNNSGTLPTLSLAAGNTDSELFTDANGNSATRGIAALGSSTNTGNENDTSETGNVDVNYGSTAVTSVSFRYYSGDGTRNGTDISFGSTNPTLQRISLSDITFVPEPATWISGGLLGFLLIGHGLRCRRARSAILTIPSGAMPHHRDMACNGSEAPRAWTVPA